MRYLKKHIQGSLAITISAVLLSLGHMFAKVLTNGGLSGMNAVFIRCIGGVTILLVLHSFKLIRLSSKISPLVLLRGIAGGISLNLFYAAIQYGSYANANALNNTYPIFVGVIAVVLLKETFNWKQLVGFFLALLGAYWIVNPQFGTISPADILGILSGLVAAVAIIALKVSHTRAEGAWNIVFSFFFFSALFALPSVSLSMLYQLPPLLWAVFGIIFCGVSGQFLLTLGYKKTPASSGSILMLSGIIWGNLLSLLLLREPLSPLFWLGSVLIFIGGVLSHQHHEAKNVTIPHHTVH